LFENEDPGTRFRARWYMAIVDVYQGHLIDARETLQEVAAADRLEGGEQAAGNGKLLLAALIEEEEGHIDRAIDIYRDVFKECRQDELEQWMERYVDLLARRDPGAARAFTDSVEALVEGTQSDAHRACWESRGWIELRGGNPDKACTWFERAAEASDEINYQYPLGLAYLQAHRAGDAVRTFEGILNRYSASRLVRPTWSVKTYYYLGRAYEETGQYRDAATYYKKFLEVWKSADPVFPELTDARARFETIAAGK
jgi:tetratricopeptide (TPR) repeat protein